MQGVHRSSSEKRDTVASIGSVATLPKNAPAGALIHTMNEIAKYGDMINEIKEVLQSARQNVAQQVNTELLTTYWNIGRIIVEHEQQSRERAEYGQQTLKELSRALTKEFGKGFSRSNLQNMRAFYLTYQKCQTPSGKLSWSHYSLTRYFFLQNVTPLGYAKRDAALR